MNILTVENITKSYGERKIFDHTGFYLQEGEKAGILGINGTGKSTLLKIIAGLEEPDEGRVIKANNTVISYLPQSPEFEAEETVMEAVLKASIEVQRQKYHGLEVTEEDKISMTAEAKIMLTKLGVNDFTQKCGTLSGGQKKRLALISVLLSPADILLLDEPTNHLDNDMADWLEEYLKKWRGALIMVTHDRYFMDSVTNRIIEIDKGLIYSYETNYSGYLELKTQRMEMEQASERKRQSILRVELEWMQRGARARSTKQKAHIQRYEELRDRQAPVQDSQVELSSASTRLGRTTVELEHICKSYGEKKMIDDFSYIFLKGDRVGFVGPNGCGKSTLMKIIAGIIPQDSGNVIIGQTVKIGYYAQEIASEKTGDEAEIDLSYMDPKQRVIDYVKDTAEYIQTADGMISASAMLEKFLFPPDKQYSPIGKLSGGEKKRLNLLRVLATCPNLLALDEPSNNLDIATLTILEDYLDRFEGIVVTISHDRYFLDRTMKRIFAFEEDGKLKQYEGGYTDYTIRKMAEQEEAEQAKKNGNVSKNDVKSSEKGQRTRGPQKLKFTYQEQRDYETIENDIAQLEEKIELLESQMTEAATDFVKLNQLMAEKEEAESKLEEKMDRWMYLEELAARIAEQ